MMHGGWRCSPFANGTAFPASALNMHLGAGLQKSIRCGDRRCLLSSEFLLSSHKPHAPYWQHRYKNRAALARAKRLLESGEKPCRRLARNNSSVCDATAASSICAAAPSACVVPAGAPHAAVSDTSALVFEGITTRADAALGDFPQRRRCSCCLFGSSQRTATRCQHRIAHYWLKNSSAWSVTFPPEMCFFDGPAIQDAFRVDAISKNQINPPGIYRGMNLPSPSAASLSCSLSSLTISCLLSFPPGSSSLKTCNPLSSSSFLSSFSMYSRLIPSSLSMTAPTSPSSTFKSYLTRYSFLPASYFPSILLLPLPFSLNAVRFKMVKSASYRRPPRASPTGQARKPHIGPRRLSAEYVTPGVVLVKQRKFVAFNLETKRRKRHFKMYPGENVGVTSCTHLVALAHGRVKYMHDVSRDVMIVNVLPERKEELLREDLWRYRTEHVRTVEENRHICFLRMKATRIFPKELVNPPTKPEPRPYHFTKRDRWENPTLPDVPIFDDDR